MQVTVSLEVKVLFHTHRSDPPSCLVCLYSEVLLELAQVTLLHLSIFIAAN